MVPKNLNKEQILNGKEVYVDILGKNYRRSRFFAVWSPVM
jgi:hypothetical protein